MELELDEDHDGSVSWLEFQKVRLHIFDFFVHNYWTLCILVYAFRHICMHSHSHTAQIHTHTHWHNLELNLGDHLVCVPCYMLGTEK